MDKRTTKPTRGFITIATGKDMYFQFAKNLLLSYKRYCKEPLPFAIMCDRENEYTALFDDVVLTENSKGAFFDKFELLLRAPYDETIFIDSDCLAYGDLNDFWEYFADADDFSGSGINYPAESKDGLFQIEEIGDYASRVKWKPQIHGGLYFFRKGETCQAIYREVQNILANYDQYRWADYCAKFADEPVLCLAMAACGCRVQDARPNNYGIPWEVTTLNCDIFTGKCAYATAWHPLTEGGHMIHWSVRYCKKPLYRFEVEKLYLMEKYDSKPPQGAAGLNLLEKLLYQYKLRYYGMLLWEFTLRVLRKIGRMLKLVKPE